ncbi:MAG: hypothetical protein WCQ61_10540, partial [Proteiniphilum sp.]
DFMLKTNLSATEFKFGLLSGNRMGFTPASFIMWSKRAVYLLEHNSVNQPAVSVFFYAALFKRHLTTASQENFRQTERASFPA